MSGPFAQRPGLHQCGSQKRGAPMMSWISAACLWVGAASTLLARSCQPARTLALSVRLTTSFSSSGPVSARQCAAGCPRPAAWAAAPAGSRQREPELRTDRLAQGGQGAVPRAGAAWRSAQCAGRCSAAHRSGRSFPGILGRAAPLGSAAHRRGAAARYGPCLHLLLKRCQLCAADARLAGPALGRGSCCCVQPCWHPVAHSACAAPAPAPGLASSVTGQLVQKTCSMNLKAPARWSCHSKNQAVLRCRWRGPGRTQRARPRRAHLLPGARPADDDEHTTLREARPAVRCTDVAAGKAARQRLARFTWSSDCPLTGLGCTLCMRLRHLHSQSQGLSMLPALSPGPPWPGFLVRAAGSPCGRAVARLSGPHQKKSSQVRGLWASRLCAQPPCYQGRCRCLRRRRCSVAEGSEQALKRCCIRDACGRSTRP